MSIWLPPIATEEPETILHRWSAFEVKILEFESRTIHVVGETLLERTGRVTSPVVSLDPSKRCVVTRSGRAYRLDGPPGRGKEALYVWGHWLTLWKAEVLDDASARLAELFATAGEVLDGMRLQ